MNWGVSTRQGPTEYLGISETDELGGGLNNILMSTAQLLHDSCYLRPNAALVLPRITSGYRFIRTTGRIRPFRFGDVFDVPTFVSGVSPCSVVEHLPNGTNLTLLRVVPINIRWNFSELLPWVYAALLPSRLLQSIIDPMAGNISAHVGSRWVGVHLRIERDWWHISGFCDLKRHRAKRCYTPDEVARLTAHRRGNTTGTVLFYAANLVAKRGPFVNYSHFGEHTLKLTPPRLPYTMQSAAEFFFAASAPGGFIGNSFSTFSKGVALMRRVQAIAHPRPGAMLSAPQSSYCYDCTGFSHRASQSLNGLLTGGRAAPHQRFRDLMGSTPLFTIADSGYCREFASTQKAERERQSQKAKRERAAAGKAKRERAAAAAARKRIQLQVIEAAISNETINGAEQERVGKRARRAQFVSPRKARTDEGIAQESTQ